MPEIAVPLDVLLDSLLLQAFKGGLGDRVVPAVALTAHAGRPADYLLGEQSMRDVFGTRGALASRCDA
jgi:hypothetical protein